MNSVVHLYLYGVIKREVNGGNLIHISKIHPLIRWTVRLPRRYQKEILHELVEYGFLKKIGRDNYEILSIRKKPLCDGMGDPLW
jgi:hypothetical protein